MEHLKVYIAFIFLPLVFCHATLHETIYDDCGTFKTCIAYPDDEPCIENKNCLTLGTVQKKGKNFIALKTL